MDTTHCEDCEAEVPETAYEDAAGHRCEDCLAEEQHRWSRWYEEIGQYDPIAITTGEYITDPALLPY